MTPCSHRYAGGGCALGLSHTSCRNCPSYTPRKSYERPLQRNLAPVPLPTDSPVGNPSSPSPTFQVPMSDMIKEQEMVSRQVSTVHVRGGCNCGKR